MVEGRPRGSGLTLMISGLTLMVSGLTLMVSGLTLSGASLPRLKRRGLTPPNGSSYADLALIFTLLGPI